MIRCNSPSDTSQDKVYIVLVNWNGWRNTIECLESVFRLNHENYTVVVCDNASSDNSFDQIRSWARGEICAQAEVAELRKFTTPPVAKPVSYAEIAPDASATTLSDARLILIQTGANLGYAGGNNAGIRYALSQGDCGYIWLLNNDTVVAPDALSHMIACLIREPEAGICGSTLLDYYNPTRIQAVGGGRFSHRTARHGLLGEGCDANSLAVQKKARNILKFICGASMLVSRHFVETVGLMSDQYFLYFEEIDWAVRAKSCFTLTYSTESIVYHKEGAAIRNDSNASRQGIRADFWMTRNRLIFTRTHYLYFVPSVCLVIAMSFVLRLLRGRFANCRAVWAGFRSGCMLRPSVESARLQCERIHA